MSYQLSRGGFMETARKKILIVEDEDEMRELIAAKLEKSGYEIFQAQNGAEGLIVAEKVIPDLILADVLMPVMDGLEFFKQLRAKPFGKETPFIVITAVSYSK